ncbi:hypothetical protein, partial [Mesorhizobium sp.]|uniref:hypothetical protein n=1 Tax=Mesorhizobium sp. TaxID=1871066 RepID=UPI00257B3BAF
LDLLDDVRCQLVSHSVPSPTLVVSRANGSAPVFPQVQTVTVAFYPARRCVTVPRRLLYRNRNVVKQQAYMSTKPALWLSLAPWI